jgi:acyl dehydratase
MSNMNVPHAGMIIHGSFFIDRDMIERFGHTCGDFNPIHFNSKSARDAGFDVGDGDAIAHGDLVIPCANRFFVERFPGIILVKRDTRFLRPIKSGQLVEFHASISEIHPTPRGQGVMITIPSQFRVLKKIAIECTTTALIKYDL